MVSMINDQKLSFHYILWQSIFGSPRPHYHECNLDNSKTPAENYTWHISVIAVSDHVIILCQWCQVDDTLMSVDDRSGSTHAEHGRTRQDIAPSSCLACSNILLLYEVLRYICNKLLSTISLTKMTKQDYLFVKFSHLVNIILHYSISILLLPHLALLHDDPGSCHL